MSEVTPSGSGGPLGLAGPARDGGLVISGGVGGISFQLEELMGGAEKLDVLASELSAVEVEMHHIWEDMSPYQNDSRYSGTEAIISVGEARRSVQAVRTELQRISRQVRASKQDYESAEALANVVHGLGLRLTSWELLGQQVADLGLGPVPNREVAEIVAGNVPVTMGAFLAFSSPAHFVTALAADLAAGKHISVAAPLIRALARQSAPVLKPRPVSVDREESLPLELDASTAGLLERARAVDERGQGYIEVIEVDNGGQKAYVVVIPGTQTETEVGGTNPFDLAGIGEGLGYGSAEVNAAVLQALQAAGAEKGSPVVAVGYSQGGVHAMNLAADELFLDEYDVKYVLTAGSPVGGITPAAGISSMHLEHRQDWVPGSDGTPSPDTVDRVTVTLTDPARIPEGEEFGLGPGHRLSGYVEGARQVEASEDPSLVASTAILGGVLGAGGTATATRFSLNRQKPPDPQSTPLTVPNPKPQSPPRPPAG
ncbi:hypothetical protein F8G81_22730 [Arthrobacter sp. CDRTa11]|uniref:hypothetical protein n=1 Tax=Arthrobacter sp. CDRTa11 TaxID=2651199 RepID=UPI002265C0E2|nr:hypothetical protein [Arthrobacter sp. CDRTa11]UZX05095.1 hypothetical protein F8G81_22730 [Arthrobacter sp. CDRTa11]